MTGCVRGSERVSPGAAPRAADHAVATPFSALAAVDLVWWSTWQAAGTVVWKTVDVGPISVICPFRVGRKTVALVRALRRIDRDKTSPVQTARVSLLSDLSAYGSAQ